MGENTILKNQGVQMKSTTIVVLVIIISLFATSFTLGCISLNDGDNNDITEQKDNSTIHQIHLWVTNQGYPQYSNISVRIDNEILFNDTAISGDGHTYYFIELNLSSGPHEISVFDRDTNTSRIINSYDKKNIHYSLDFSVKKEIWITVSFWFIGFEDNSPMFQINFYEEQPGIT